jgi:hypothetical protein
MIYPGYQIRGLPVNIVAFEPAFFFPGSILKCFKDDRKNYFIHDSIHFENLPGPFSGT